MRIARLVGVDGELLEATWQRQIIELAVLSGWSAHHIYDSRRSTGDGWPDLSLAKPSYPVLYAELKRHDGVISQRQRYWLTLLASTPGARCYLWRAPKIADSNAIWREISAILIQGPDTAPETTLWTPTASDLALVHDKTFAYTITTHAKRQPRSSNRSVS